MGLTISASAWNWVPVMISGSVGTQFSSIICDSNAVYGADDFCVSMELGSGDDFWVGWESVFVNDL